MIEQPRAKKYLQIFDQISSDIKKGRLKTGEKLPTEKELCEQFSSSRETVRKALRELESAAVIEKIQGSGSYVKGRAGAKPTATHNMAVITTYINTHIFPSILRGIENVATQSGYTIFLKATNNSVASERAILSSIAPLMIDGIIVEGTKTTFYNPNLDFYRNYLDANIPIVFINGYYPDLFSQNEQRDKIAYVVADDYNGGYRLVSELVRQGHKKIGAIFKSDDIQGQRRYSGYLDAMMHYDVGFLDENVVWFNTETKLCACEKLISPDWLGGLDAVICYNDEIAAQLLELMRKTGQSEIAVRSFDGIYPEKFSGYDFKSLLHPKEELGVTAVRLLIDMMQGGPGKEIVLPWNT